MDWATAHSYAAADVHGTLAATKKASAPVRDPTQRPIVPSFTSVVEEFRTFHLALVDSNIMLFLLRLDLTRDVFPVGLPVNILKALTFTCHGGP